MVAVVAFGGVETHKRRLCHSIDARAALLTSLSHGIHARPEEAFHEHWAAGAIASILERGGMRVERDAFGLPTSFRATAGPDHGPDVVICCEYDALPGMGHACGHNVVAAAGAGAGLALAPLATRLGRRLTVLGTPAEESGGGKILLADRGAFQDAIAVMLVHPGVEDIVTPSLRAALGLEADFHGRAAHAAMAPERGRNALDAAVVAYNAAGALRSTLAAGEQINAMIESGGPPNVVPAHAGIKFVIRGATRMRAKEVAERVSMCCQGAAAAVGCEARLRRTGPVYANFVVDDGLAALFTANAQRIGRHMTTSSPLDIERAGSTDLGNVSHLAPTIHPKLAIAPTDVPQHTPGFASHAIGPRADRAVLDGAKAMAMTVADLWLRGQPVRPLAVGPDAGSYVC
jgi:amidohydrolase